ncbi:MAG: thioredoxin domain-containing protein [Deltaproteobacteria bacterium]|nr:thioredoxin domain-containing protein [Deltaproteobacteria bacterium]
MPEKKQNHLGQEKSPYLLQHKDNPVHWYAWGDEAFAAARAENKPIFLSIGYSTCYWCHMMEKDSFEKQEVADLLNQYFISIKVDREEHPDVDQIYMDAVVGMTGRGGWPMSVFLTPDLKPFFGGTFFWKDQFMELLNRIHSTWSQEPKKIFGAAEEIMRFLEEKNQAGLPGQVNLDLLKSAFHQFEQSFDETHGGFGMAPKFPPSMGISLLLRIHRRTGNQQALQMATKTLDAMAHSGIYDKIGGGFHRYATREDWNEPHYEKMLYDNALLTTTYLEGYQVTQNKLYSEIVGQTLDYVLREMTDPEGGFYSAQDAGEVGKEGEYYHLNKEERAKHEPPHKDDKILTSWNGLMIAAMAKGYQALGDEKYLKAAQKAARFIEKNLYKNRELLRRYREGEAKLKGTLEDYAFLIHGLLALYESDFDPKWLQWAKELQSQQDKLLWDDKDGGYFMIPEGTELIVRKKEFHDGAIPSGNSIAALNLLRLHDLLLEQDYRKKADALFSAALSPLSQYPAGHGQLLQALDYRLDRSKEIAVIGEKGDPRLDEIRRYLHQTFLPNAVYAMGDAGLPLLEGKTMIDGKTTVYVCEGFTCKKPTTDLEEAKRLIEGFEKYGL